MRAPPFVCPRTRAPLEEWYSSAADQRYPLVDGLPILVPDPRRYLLRHGPWAPAPDVAGGERRFLGLPEPDAITPFLPPMRLPARGPLQGWLASLGDRDPDSVCSEWGRAFAPKGLAADLGCGVGGVALRMGQQGREAVALDLSLEAVSMCRALLSGSLDSAAVRTHSRGAEQLPRPFEPLSTHVHYAVGDLRSPPLPPRSLAWAHLGMVLDVLSPDEGVKVLMSTVELLMPGGVLTLSTAYGSEDPPLPLEPHPEPELREVMETLRLRPLSEQDDVVRVRRSYDRRYELLLTHCSCWQAGA